MFSKFPAYLAAEKAFLASRAASLQNFKKSYSQKNSQKKGA